jgi:hypothetical protein
LYGYETWCLTLSKEHKWRVFENRVVRGVFGSDREEVTGGWRKTMVRRFITFYQILIA